MVEGDVDGGIWVDDEDSPAFIHVINAYGMTLLVVLDPDADLAPLGAHFAEIRTRAAIWLQLHPQEFAPRLESLLDADIAPVDSLPDGVSVQRFTRVNFTFDAEEYAARRPEWSPASGRTLSRMTASEFALPGITVSPHLFWRDAEQFLERGGGWCVCEGDAVCSMAFSSFQADSRLELGVETRTEYRGRGYARLACAALIDECLATGLEPVWSCRKENVASGNLARALGFVPSLETVYYHLPKTPRSDEARAAEAVSG
ncbi:MAG: GNAT family N-acetyltransferase [Anaerosomatales bacterium]|nr:GNAT family N-acetyltransferase [Anaerosomatales bacterium]MDT8434984.1 GNAT family N-acetyltransferase [Anaerosomatales bacterium]